MQVGRPGKSYGLQMPAGINLNKKKPALGGARTPSLSTHARTRA